jgi:uncharacterized protein (DUF924 family)
VTGREPAAETILDFWFAGATADPAAAAAREPFWFGASAATDAEVRERFSPAVEAAARGELDAWRAEPRAALARVVLLDQFPRNAWRGTARAFSFDPHAQRAADEAIAAGYFAALGPIERSFLVLPYQHAEALQRQRESVRLAAEIRRDAGPAWEPVLSRYLDFAREHLAIIERFGRFPHRNRALGRPSTRAEAAYLASGAAAFGQGSG